MLKPDTFEQLFSKMKDYLPDLTVREKIKKLLEEHDILTQEQLQMHIQQVERMRAELSKLEERITQMEKEKK